MVGEFFESADALKADYFRSIFRAVAK